MNNRVQTVVCQTGIHDGGQRVNAVLALQLQTLTNIGVILNEFGGDEAKRNICGLPMVLNLVNHRVDTGVNRAGGAEVIDRGIASVFGRGNGGGDQFIHTLIFHGCDRDHGIPSARDMPCISIVPPLAETSSIIFKANTTGTFISISWSVRYRLRQY